MKIILLKYENISIEKSVELNIYEFMKSYSREVGGIIGSVQGKISSFVSDAGIEETNIHDYKPNISYLNETLVSWNNDGIKFEGLIHSHIERIELSYGDICYAQKILDANKMESILMPIYVHSIDKIMWYLVKKD